MKNKHPDEQLLGKLQNLLKVGSNVDMIKRIRNDNAFYADNDVNYLMQAQLPFDTFYISPAVAVVSDQIEQAISNHFIDDPAKQRAIIAIHSENHFMGIYLYRTTDDQVSIVYYDPTVSNQSKQPLHSLPDGISNMLAQKFPNTLIIHASSENIQTYTTQGSSTETLNMLDNNHCGPFVICIMTEMSKGNIRLNPDGTRKLQIKFGDGNWKDFPSLSKEQSNDFGIAIRKDHLTLLANNHGAEDDRQINTLRNLIQLETMSTLESSLPKVATKK